MGARRVVVSGDQVKLGTGRLPEFLQPLQSPVLRVPGAFRQVSEYEQPVTGGQRALEVAEDVVVVLGRSAETTHPRHRWVVQVGVRGEEVSHR